ncbi:bacterio-opsin activator HTH domain protein [Halorhabdus tiamatea SARL4B]|nr:bacterio-opsin activator HTH domain protein [Halorhabdus tiamatea SARL4B]
MSVKFHLHRLFQSDSDDIDEYGLTAQQHNALAVAYDEGYFEIPREATLEDLADELDTTTSALSELLRRGQRRLVGRTVAALEGT